MIRLLYGVIVGVAIVACGDSGGPSELRFLAKVLGDSQSIAVSTASNPMQVQVVDTLGQPIVGVPINFTLTQGTGSLIARDTSDETGVAQTIFTADATPGTRKIKASGVVTDIVFTLFVVAAPAPREK